MQGDGVAELTCPGNRRQDGAQQSFVPVCTCLLPAVYLFACVVCLCIYLLAVL